MYRINYCAISPEKIKINSSVITCILKRLKFISVLVTLWKVNKYKHSYCWLCLPVLKILLFPNLQSCFPSNWSIIDIMLMDVQFLFTEGNRLFSCLEQEEDENYDVTTIPPNDADHPVSTTVPSLDTPKQSLVKEFQPVSLSPVRTEQECCWIIWIFMLDICEIDLNSMFFCEFIRIWQLLLLQPSYSMYSQRKQFINFILTSFSFIMPF